MSQGLYSRVKNWIAENLTPADINAEFNNIITNSYASKLGGHSDNTTQMRTTANPGGEGTEDTGTDISIADELERIRYVINRIIGGNYWYSTPPVNLTQADTRIQAAAPETPENRLVSGRKDADNQPMFLVPNGSTNSVSLQAASTNLSCYIDGVETTVSTNLTLSSLTLAPSSNNTATVSTSSKIGTADDYALGEDAAPNVDPFTFGFAHGANWSIDMSSVGTEISNLVGKYAAFKVVNGGSTEYFMAFVESSTRLTRCRRGWYFDSADARKTALEIDNGDTISLMRMSHIFLVSGSALDVTYNMPTSGPSQPSSPAAGDYWFDTSTSRWKKYSGTVWANASALYLGQCLQDTSATVAARSDDFFSLHDQTNEVKLYLESSTSVKSAHPGEEIAVMGNFHKNQSSLLSWSTTGIESGVTLTSGRTVFFYVKDTGATVISHHTPQNRLGDLKGLYHPGKPWRAVGSCATDGTNFTAPIISFGVGMPKYRAYRGDPQNIKADVGVINTTYTTGAVNSATYVPGYASKIMCRGRPILFSTFNQLRGVATVVSPAVTIQPSNVAYTGVVSLALIGVKSGTIYECHEYFYASGVTTEQSWSDGPISTVFTDVPDNEECYVGWMVKTVGGACTFRFYFMNYAITEL